MPRRQQPPRLYLRERKGRGAVWVILDRGREHGTRCSEGQCDEAEAELARYLARTRLRAISRSDPSQVLIADVLTFYSEHRAPELARSDMIPGLMTMLLEHAGPDKCDVINGDWCRSYVKKRVAGKIAPEPLPGRQPKKPQESSVRRDLEHLSACLGYAVKEGVLAYAPKVTFPPASEPRQAFLTRDQAAKLLWTCWRYEQHGPKNQTLYPLRHLCRFILIGLYTGTRSSAILSASFTAGAGRSYVDLETGVFHRLAEGRRRTNKLQPKIHMPDSLVAHLRRWQRKSNSGWVVTFHGEPVASVKKAFARAVNLAGLKGITPHALRHTFMTWALNRGMDLHMAAKIAGMSVRIADKVYGHLDTSRREALNAVFRGHNLGATRTTRVKIA